MTRVRPAVSRVPPRSAMAVAAAVLACIAGVVLLAVDGTEGGAGPAWLDELGVVLVASGLLVFLLIGLLPDRAVAVRRHRSTEPTGARGPRRGLVVPPPGRPPPDRGDLLDPAGIGATHPIGRRHRRRRLRT